MRETRLVKANETRDVANHKPLNVWVGQHQLLEQRVFHPVDVKLLVEQLQTVPQVNVVQPAKQMQNVGQYCL